tara:strand:- start:4153 stop:4638 length:486 start_codon:yes stop_codon:yes gene_type:complete
LPVNPTFSELLRSPVLLLAYGFGSGLSSRAPGTMGTLAAIPIWYWMSDWSLANYVIAVYLAALVGTYICDRAAAKVGVHDPAGIVWDEFVGFWIAMLAVPPSWLALAVGFALFRLFDIVKPWPISWLDKHVDGGLGIMLDDIAAGLITALLMAALRFVGWL